MENDKQLFEQIFQKNRDRVFRLCCLYTGDADQRKDLMQDIFIRVWESLDSYRGDAAMSTWIYRIALNTCLTHVRSLKRGLQTRSIPDGFDILDTEPPTGMEPSVEHLIRCINLLEPSDRTIIGLYLEDLPQREIADILGISEANIRVKIHRIKQRLSDIATEQFPQMRQAAV
ncbi:RNA polymerase sigma factor [uncultured Acetobacteroides sp.]|uniref:RNA polymerase sigma factor n=1 Tax=uncultured Acetobacteroides sp. TaxID=1760811 RepID=UPI0029F48550|nr:RNA polymerase sigma factor [uncultured Acetobacteroides sp.]